VANPEGGRKESGGGERVVILFPLELNLPVVCAGDRDAHKRLMPWNPAWECKFIIRKANWGQLVTIYDINTKYLFPVVIYALAYKKRLLILVDSST